MEIQNSNDTFLKKQYQSLLDTIPFSKYEVDPSFVPGNKYFTAIRDPGWLPFRVNNGSDILKITLMSTKGRCLSVPPTALIGQHYGSVTFEQLEFNVQISGASGPDFSVDIPSQENRLQVKLSDFKDPDSPYKSYFNVNKNGEVRFRLSYTNERQDSDEYFILDSGFFKPDIYFLPCPILHLKPALDFSRCWDNAHLKN